MFRQIANVLRAHGHAFNVFTPGGIHAVHELYGVNVADIVIADLERRVRLRAAYRTTFDPEAADVV